ncbi:unnamed protein product, partial [Symbiodinium necroappetens]
KVFRGGIQQRLRAAGADRPAPYQEGIATDSESDGDEDDGGDDGGPPDHDPDLMKSLCPKSCLGRELLELFAWGNMSPQLLQKLADAARKDMVTTLEEEHGVSASAAASPSCLQELTMLASIGSFGKFSNKCYSDLMRKVEPRMCMAETYKAKLCFANPPGEHTQELLLPHELFACMYEDHGEAFVRNVCGDEETRLGFWDRMRTVPHPAWEGHPVQTRDLKGAIPIAVHGDEVPIAGIGKQWSKKLLNVSWSSLLGESSTKSTQYWCFGLIEKTGIKEGPKATMQQLWKIFAWSLTALWLGYWPTRDHEGRRFPAGSIQAERAGQALAGGFYGVLWSLIGDLDYFTQILQLPNYNNATMPCPLCRASLSGNLTWSNFSSTAPWRATMWRPHTWHLWPDRSRNPVFSIPGVSSLQIALDYMHSKYLGTDQFQFGSVLSLLVYDVMDEGSPELNLAACWRFMREYYRIHQTAVRFRSMSRLTMFTRRSGGPKLRGKAAEIRYFGEVLLALWTTYCNDELLVHKQVTLLLKRNVFMERMITEHQSDLFLDDGPAALFQQACADMLVLHGELALHFSAEGMQYFALTSKAHMLQHACDLSRCLSPRTVWCFIGEDLQQKLQRVASMSLKGNVGPNAINKMFRRYRLGLNLIFEASS